MGSRTSTIHGSDACGIVAMEAGDDSHAGKPVHAGPQSAGFFTYPSKLLIASFMT